MAPWRKTATSEQSALVPAGGAAGGSAASSAPQAATMQGTGFTNTRRKQASVIEMLEYVKSLDIDPVKEADMLWIAEEAFNAALPPAWSEHQDDEGRVYFHNGTTGESVWRHPMDDLFREIVEYQRRVVRDGGFHGIEDEIAELEENIRRDLASWMELFDEHGEKFFYNKTTDDSRFDDPRMAVYHNLYTRIKMVAKMKERLPVLARAPRPEAPTQQELELRRRQQLEEERYLKCLIKIQSLGRVCLARKKYRAWQAQATVQKGPQPLRGKFRLRLDKASDTGKRELVLAMTTPHRRHRAAMKAQALAKGYLARRRIRPLILHRAFLSRIVTKIQARARVWLAKRAAVRQRHMRKDIAATRIQRCFRGHRDRVYVRTLFAQRARYVRYMESVLKVQTQARGMIARNERKRRYMARQRAAMMRIKAQAEVWRARSLMERIQLYTDHASAIKVQALMRGFLDRRRVKHLRVVARDAIQDLMDSVWQDVDRRIEAAAKMQGSIRMQETQKMGLLAKKRMEFMQRCSQQVELVQAACRVYAEQAKAINGIAHECTWAAIRLQAAWRGTMVRNRLSGRWKEPPMILKGTFEYRANTQSGCAVEVRFEPSPGFDDYKYIVEHGRPAVVALGSSIKNLHTQLRSSMSEIHELLGGVPEEFAVEGGESASPKPAPQVVEGLQAPEEASFSSSPSRLQVGSASQAGSRRPSNLQGRSRVGSKLNESRSPSKMNESRSPSRVTDVRRPSHLAPSAAGSALAAAGAADAPAGGDVAAGGGAAAAPAAVAIEQPPTSPQTQGAGANQQASARGSAIASASAMDSARGSMSGSPSRPTPSVVHAVTEDATQTEGDAQALPDMAQSSPTSPQQQAQQDSQQVPASPGATQEAFGEATAEGFEAGASETASTAIRPRRKKSPAKRKALVSTSEAHSFFMQASSAYSDKAPPRHPDDAPRPPPSGKPGQPQPPAPDPNTATVQGLRASQSDSNLRKSYAGQVVGGKFVRTAVNNLDDMSEQDRKQVLEDLERQRAENQALVAERAKLHKARKQKEEQSKAEKFRAERERVEREEEERRKDRAKEMKKWLKAKEDEVKAKKSKEGEAMQAIMDKEREKAEAIRKIELERREERERRLRIAEKQKAKLEMQMMLQRQQQLGLAPPMPIKARGLDMEGMDPQATAKAGQQRVVHRHVHHHLHYHDGQEGYSSGEEFQGSDEERRNMEFAAERESAPDRRGTSKSGEWAGDAGATGRMLPQIDARAETPLKHRSYSTGQLLSYDDAMRMSKTQQAFKRAGLPQLQNYQKGLQKALGSYADSGRPRRLQAGAAY